MYRRRRGYAVSVSASASPGGCAGYREDQPPPVHSRRRGRLRRRARRAQPALRSPNRPAARSRRRPARDRRRARRVPRALAARGRSAGGRSAPASASRSPASPRSPPSGVDASRTTHQVLDPDAEGAFAVVARLVRQDHARPRAVRPTVATGPLRPFVHAEIGCRRRGRCRDRSRARPATAPRAPARRCPGPRGPPASGRRLIAIRPFSTRVKRRARPRPGPRRPRRCG